MSFTSSINVTLGLYVKTVFFKVSAIAPSHAKIFSPCLARSTSEWLDPNFPSLWMCIWSRFCNITMTVDIEHVLPKTNFKQLIMGKFINKEIHWNQQPPKLKLESHSSLNGDFQASKCHNVSSILEKNLLARWSTLFYQLNL